MEVFKLSVVRVKNRYKKAQLEKEGYKCLGDKKLDSLREALTTGTLLWEGVTKKLNTPSIALRSQSVKASSC